MNKINETIARLDRVAAVLGLDLKERGVNTREFDAFGRTLRYRPGGKGVVRVESWCDGQLDAVAYREQAGMESLFAQAVALGEATR